MTDFELEAGQMVGEYRVERKIGEGAFGKVYAAVHPVIGKPAAIKVLRPELSANQEMVQRFTDEARAVNQIRHRHIIDIFSFGTLPNGLSYFVMELLEGITFQKYLRTNGPLDPALALSILWPVGRALSATHKAGIAHRDLKPENVFLIMDQDGGMFPKLLDFGIAKLQSESDAAHRTRTGMILGTPVYMSPEQCRATQVDHRSDIYAFGIMTHEALTGSRPFDAENVMDIMMKQISDPPPRMSAVRPGLPPALDAPVLRMLEKSAAKRPQSIQAALDELAEAARACGIAIPSSQAFGGPVSSGAVIPAPSPAARPLAPQPAPAAPPASSPADTAAWLQQRGPQSSMAVPNSSMAIPQPSMAVQGSMAVAAASAPGPTDNPYSSQAVPSAQGYPPHSHPAPSGPASFQAPPSAPASYGAAPQGDMATLLSAGVSPYGARPSMPDAGPVSMPDAGPVSMPGAGPVSMPGAGPVSFQGMGPMSGPAAQGAPAAGKSNLPIFLGAGGAVVLLLIGALAFLGGGGGSGSSAGSGAGSGATSASTAAPTTVQLGSGAPRVGRSFRQEQNMTIQMGFTVPGSPKKISVTVHEHKKLKVTVLAVDDWSATRIEVHYSESSESTAEGDAKPKVTSQPTAHKGYFVSAQASGPAVSAVDGHAVTEEEKDAVISDVGELVKPRPDLFRRPLAVGDTLSPPPAVAASLLGLEADEEDRLEKASLKLASIDQARRAAAFDVRVTYIHDEGKEGDFYSADMKGSMTYDIDTSIATAGTLSGPLTGKTVYQGTKIPLEGTIDLDVQSTVDR